MANSGISTPLPKGVLSDLGGWTVYQSYRTFTWPWLIRRGLVFWPLALLAGAAFAAWHSSGMGAWSDWPGLALRAALAGIVVVSAGPLLATGVRHAGLPPLLERILIAVAVLVGFWLGARALGWAGAHHDHLMERYAGMSMEVSAVGKLISRMFRATIDTSMLVLVIAGGGLAVIYYFGEGRRVATHEARMQVETLEAERNAADMRLAVLQAQVEPHFLFNTLASIRSLIGPDPQRASQTVDALARYLRATLPRLRDAGVEQSSLERQIDICRGYLDLMKIRMGGRLRTRIEIDPATAALTFPPLILITLVENAITHGVEPAKGRHLVTIRASVEDDRLVVVVEDDGVGLRPGPSSGMGLANVRAQLRDRYGDEASLEVRQRPEGGVMASITIPVEAP